MKKIAAGGNIRHESGWRKCARHIRAVIRGVLYTGFTVQIFLGIFWLCLNFFHVQDFGWPDPEETGFGGGIFALCRSLFGLFGAAPPFLYLLQLCLAFYAGYRFLKKHVADRVSGNGGIRKGFCAWGSLALMTFPFAMQCHMAILPYSVISSLFLLMLSFLLEAVRERACVKEASGNRVSDTGGHFAAALVCGALAIVLAGSIDGDSNGQGGVWGRGVEAALASRFAWPDIWNDFDRWPEELREITEDAVWETSFCPGNMELLLEAIEDRTGREAARAYYRQIAEIGWNNHRSMVIRQIGWDALGYGLTPLIFPLQMEGQAYDSCSGRNYEIMRMHTPVLTGYYVDYGCWWFGCFLVLAFILALLRLTESGIKWKSMLLTAGICILAAAVPVFFYTMRGAGFMDYKCTIAVNELWFIWGFLFMGGSRDGEGKEMS